MDNLEKILYERKVSLKSEQKWNTEHRLNFGMTIVGAFIGAYISYAFNNFITNITNLINTNIFEADPMEILYSKDQSIYFWVHIFLIIVLGFGVSIYMKKKDNEVDGEFCNDMIDYELDKIGELIKQL